VLSPFYDADALLPCCGVTYIVHSTQMYEALYRHGGCRKDIEVKLCLSVLDLMKLNSPIITPQDSEHINDEYLSVLFPFVVYSSVRSCNVEQKVLSWGCLGYICIIKCTSGCALVSNVYLSIYCTGLLLPLACPCAKHLTSLHANAFGINGIGGAADMGAVKQVILCTPVCDVKY
jgi:hypothetical protein